MLDERRKKHPTQLALILTLALQMLAGVYAFFKLTAQLADEHGRVIQYIDDIGKRMDRLENRFDDSRQRH